VAATPDPRPAVSAVSQALPPARTIAKWLANDPLGREDHAQHEKFMLHEDWTFLKPVSRPDGA